MEFVKIQYKMIIIFRLSQYSIIIFKLAILKMEFNIVYVTNVII